MVNKYSMFRCKLCNELLHYWECTAHILKDKEHILWHNAQPAGKDFRSKLYKVEWP